MTNANGRTWKGYSDRYCYTDKCELAFLGLSRTPWHADCIPYLLSRLSGRKDGANDTHPDYRGIRSTARLL